MDNKADVKAIMARFQASGASTDETPPTPTGRPKQPLQPTLSSGLAAQKKQAFENFSGSPVNVSPKPTFLKNTVSAKSDTDTQESSKTKAIANRFANNRDDTGINSKPFIGSKPTKPSFSRESELNPPAQKPPFTKPPLSSTLSESKPAFPKPPSGLGSKPNWVKEDSGGGGSPLNKSPLTPKVPSVHQKPSSSIGKLRQQTEEQAESSTSSTKSVNNPSTPTTSGFKPTPNFKTAQNMFNKDKDKEEMDSGATSKPALTATNSVPRPPPASKKPSLRKKSMSSLPSSGVNGDATSEPKRKTLTNTLALGAAPAKPNRPPKVNLDSFKRGADSSNDGPTFKKSTIPLPPTSHPSTPSNKVAQIQPPPPAPPSLPPRHLASMNPQEDFYDDVEELNSAPPPLPPSTGHPSQRVKEENDEDDDDEDGEMYEDLDERWEKAEKKQEKKKDKSEKEEKKRLEAEKKEQREREKKEQDARKKFKLVGPLEVIHQGKAGADCKGGKGDLALKQGDPLDIIRVQGNPEGKWLGRMADGSIGYVKTTLVKIDFNTLKSRQVQQAYDPEVYDDIDVLSSDQSSGRSSGVVLPPLPGDGEIYDDCVDPNLEVRVPPPSQFTEGNSDQPGATIDEEIYDDVDSQNAPPPLPPISSLPAMKLKGRGEKMDAKKQKKFEKEEKEFRKNFKYEGEIQVLYQVTINHMATNKKWSHKELPVKAGEKLDVIVKAVDNKLTCRNEDGKFGYVSTSHIVMDDGDIYDDIGDDSIYDND